MRIQKLKTYYPGGGTLFTPTSVAGLETWIDFSDVSTLYQDSGKTTPVTADNDPIGAAEDKSGNGADAIQANIARRPSYRTAVKNGLSCAQGDGVDDVLDANLNLTTSTEATFFLVWRSRIAPDGTTRRVWGGGDGVKIELASGGHATNPRYYYTWAVIGSAAVDWMVWSGKITNPGTTNYLYLGTALDNTCGDTYHDFKGGYLFHHKNQAGKFDGYIGEFLKYDGWLSDTDREAVATYLGNKWDI